MATSVLFRAHLETAKTRTRCATRTRHAAPASPWPPRASTRSSVVSPLWAKEMATCGTRRAAALGYDRVVDEAASSSRSDSTNGYRRCRDPRWRLLSTYVIGARDSIGLSKLHLLVADGVRDLGGDVGSSCRGGSIFRRTPTRSREVSTMWGMVRPGLSPVFHGCIAA